MQYNYSPQRDISDREMAFERERLLNLIECRLQRQELGLAQEHAAELFSREREFELLRKARQLARLNRLCSRAIFALACIFCLFTIGTVLNIGRFVITAIGGIALSVLSVVSFEAFIARRYEKAMTSLRDFEDAERQLFIRKVIERCGKEAGGTARNASCAAASFRGRPSRAPST